MRKLKIMQHISLDGVIQQSADDNDFPYSGWSAPYRTPAGLATVLEMYGERFDLLLGRRTYDLWSGFWPKAPSSPMGDRLNAATKYVVTHRPESLQWGPSQAITADWLERVRALKADNGADLILSGSTALTSALIEHGLADEMALMVNPILLGTARRIFAEGTPARSFELVSTRSFATGIVLNAYKFAGSLKS